MDFIDWFDDEFEIEDFALIGGLIGAVEEEMEEERERLEHDLWFWDESDKESEENE